MKEIRAMRVCGCKRVVILTVGVLLAATNACADFVMGSDVVIGKPDAKPANTIATTAPSKPAAEAAVPTVVGKPTPEPSKAISRNVRPSDVSLRRLIERWSKEEGWQIDWAANVDYPINLSAQFEGTFEEAVSALLESYRNSDVPLEADMYPQNKAMRVYDSGTK